MPNITSMETQKSQEVVNSQEKLIIVEKIFLDIGKQMLETSYTLNLGQLFKIILGLKKYLWHKLKPKKTQNLNRATTDKQVSSLVPKVRTIVVTIYNHTAVIQVHIGKNTIEDVLLDGGFGVNIITKQLKLKLGLPKPKLTPYNLRMADQTTNKLVGLIKDLKIYVHGIPYIITFTIFHNNLVDFSYSMLLGRPWLRDAKVAYDWGSNIVMIQGNGIIRIITITKHLGGEIRRLEVLLCYNYQNGIIDEEEDIIFAIEPKLFSIGIIDLLEIIQYVKTIDVDIIDTDVKTNILELEFEV
jgi:hypothetical protein